MEQRGVADAVLGALDDALASKCGVQENDLLIACVSGGPDSVALVQVVNISCN